MFSAKSFLRDWRYCMFANFLILNCLDSSVFDAEVCLFLSLLFPSMIASEALSEVLQLAWKKQLPKKGRVKHLLGAFAWIIFIKIQHQVDTQTLLCNFGTIAVLWASICFLELNFSDPEKQDGLAICSALMYWRGYLEHVANFLCESHFTEHATRFPEHKVDINALIVVVPNSCSFPSQLHRDLNGLEIIDSLMCEVPLGNVMLNRRPPIKLTPVKIYHGTKAVKALLNFPTCLNGLLTENPAKQIQAEKFIQILEDKLKGNMLIRILRINDDGHEENPLIYGQRLYHAIKELS